MENECLFNVLRSAVSFDQSTVCDEVRLDLSVEGSSESFLHLAEYLFSFIHLVASHTAIDN